MNGEKLGSFKVLKRSIGVNIAHNPQNSCKNAFLTNMFFFFFRVKKKLKKIFFLRGFLDFVEFFPKTQEKLKKTIFFEVEKCCQKCIFRVLRGENSCNFLKNSRNFRVF